MQLGTSTQSSPSQARMLCLNAEDRTVVIDGTTVNLGATEYGVLHQLVVADGESVSWSELASIVWGDPGAAGTHTLQIAARRLQAKLGSERVRIAEQGVALHSA
jgi:DNA-binding response OmpR family regulator